MNITVIIVTRKRFTLLDRAIASINQQDFDGKVKILIFIDDCSKTKRCLEKNYTQKDNFKWIFCPRRTGEKSGAVRLAYLRNRAIEASDTTWISFLDDDNEFESYHLSSLMHYALENNSEAIHSYRKLFYADGTPYYFSEELSPWVRDIEKAKEQFKLLSLHGVVRKGSNIIKDKVDLEKKFYRVDTNVWLIKRKILLQYKIPEEFTSQDWMNNVYEDEKLLQKLINHDVKIHCNKLSSVKYYLGGYSNILFMNKVNKQNVYAEEWEEL